MIPRAYVIAWRKQAPWNDDALVEQDLVLSRALVEIFSEEVVADQLAFRGDTALHKLFIRPPGRYSEDIDLVQTRATPIGPAMDSIRSRLDEWLGTPSYKQSHGRVTLLYRFQSELEPAGRRRLKIEINTREHFTVLGLISERFEVTSRWFTGSVPVTVFQLDELLGTKLRALYQRKKGRDLFDLWLALTSRDVQDARVIECLRRHMEHGETTGSRAEFEENLFSKMKDASFREDVLPLLPSHVRYDPDEAARLVQDRLVSRLAGDPWKGSLPTI